MDREKDGMESKKKMKSNKGNEKETGRKRIRNAIWMRIDSTDNSSVRHGDLIPVPPPHLVLPSLQAARRNALCPISDSRFHSSLIVE